MFQPHPLRYRGGSYSPPVPGRASRRPPRYQCSNPALFLFLGGSLQPPSPREQKEAGHPKGKSADGDKKVGRRDAHSGRASRRSLRSGTACGGVIPYSFAQLLKLSPDTCVRDNPTSFLPVFNDPDYDEDPFAAIRFYSSSILNVPNIRVPGPWHRNVSGFDSETWDRIKIKSY
jgi:hypothetical protein